MQNKGDVHDCELIVAWESPYKIYFSYGMKKGHAHFQSLNTMIKRMEESGILKSLKNRHFLEFKSCKRSSVTSVGMEKVITIFIFLSSTTIASLLLIFFEFIHKRYKKTR